MTETISVREYKLIKSKYGSKYKNKPQKCKFWHSHRSGLESEYCFFLWADQQSKDSTIQEYKFEPRFDLLVNGIHICHHKPDFLVTRKDGSQEIHETKGKWTPDGYMRWNLLKATHPEFKYYLIK